MTHILLAVIYLAFISLGLPDSLLGAAALAGLFYLGITAGRAVSGFLTEWISDDGMIRLGTGILAAGFLILLFPGGGHSQAGLLLMGLGCAPIYPSVIHSTPSRFGAELSQAVIGVQMAGAYIGSSLMPPFFGFLADHLGASLYPYYLLVGLVVVALMHERIIRGVGAVPAAGRIAVHVAGHRNGNAIAVHVEGSGKGQIRTQILRFKGHKIFHMYTGRVNGQHGCGLFAAAVAALPPGIQFSG